MSRRRGPPRSPSYAAVKVPSSDFQDENEVEERKTVMAEKNSMDRCESSLHRNWKVSCAGGWVSFVALEIYVHYDRQYSSNPLCPHSDKGFGDVYWYTNYTCLGGFIITWISVFTNLIYAGPMFERVPALITLNIVSMALIATFLALVFEWGGTCIDLLNVATPAAIWGEWIATAPLLVFITVTIIDKQRLSPIDNFLMLSFFLCCLFGFFIVFKQPQWLAKFWFTMSCLTYLPIFYLPWHEEEAPRGEELPAVNLAVMKTLVNSKKAKRSHLSIWLNIIFPLYTVNYIIAMYGYIDKPTTIAIFQILSVLTKGVFATLVMDFQKASSGELQKLADCAANESRRNFTKYIFHEVRSPLNSLVMGIEILQRSANIDAMEQEILSGMKLAATFMGNTLNDVLSLQKIEEGKLELETVDFDVTDVVNTVFATCKASAQSKDINLVSDLAQNLPKSILGDRFKIEHVLCNLLTNAIKFSPANSTVTVRATHSAFADDPVSGAKRVMMEIAVVDQGPGISAANITRLFQSFVQIRPGALQKGQGSGLGLSICKEIVVAHGGTIDVSSEEGKGSTFYFKVPLCIDVSHKNAVPSASDMSFENAAGLTANFDLPNVLVVDDVEVNRKMLVMLIKRKKLICQMAEDGQQAIDMVMQDMEAYKLIFMDNFMPNVDGVKATRILRENGFRYFIVGLTGNVMDEDVEEYLRAGADLVLAKPLQMNKLEILLAHVAAQGCESKQNQNKHLVEEGNRLVWRLHSS